MDLYSSQHPDAIVVSADLPDLSINAVLRLLHESGASPVIALSNSDDEDEAILSLEMGAVEVLNSSRPERVREGAARIWSAIWNPPATSPEAPQPIVQMNGSVRSPNVLVAGPVEVDLVRRQIRVRGLKVDARPTGAPSC